MPNFAITSNMAEETRVSPVSLEFSSGTNLPRHVGNITTNPIVFCRFARTTAASELTMARCVHGPVRKKQSEVINVCWRLSRVKSHADVPGQRGNGYEAGANGAKSRIGGRSGDR